MMDRVFSGASVRPYCVPASQFQLFLVQGGLLNVEGAHGPQDLTLPTSPGDMLRVGSLDLVACNIVLLDIWHSAIMDGFSEDLPPPTPFWRNDSAQATIETRLLEFEMSKSTGTNFIDTTNISNRSSLAPLYLGGISPPCS